MVMARLTSEFVLTKAMVFEKDLICAAEYFSLSADQGNALGQFQFGVWLEKGIQKLFILMGFSFSRRIQTMPI
jgi:TPR repeat protein